MVHLRGVVPRSMPRAWTMGGDPSEEASCRTCVESPGDPGSVVRLPSSSVPSAIYATVLCGTRFVRLWTLAGMHWSTPTVRRRPSPWTMPGP